MKLDDIRVDGHSYKLSLTKFVGRPIKDVIGYLNDIGAGPSFMLTEIVLEDGAMIGVEGEHDFPFLCEYRSESPLGLDPGCAVMLDLQGQEDNA